VPWFKRLLTKIYEDAAKGAMPRSWITPTLIKKGETISSTSSRKPMTLRRKKNLSFCPGAIIDGTPHPFVVGAGTVNSPVSQNILIFIANSRVYHTTIQSGTGSNKELGLHIFPKSVLQ
jgi:hypothetical protein